MHEDLVRAPTDSHLHERMKVFDVAVDAPIRHEPHEMHGGTGRDGLVDRIREHRALEEGAVFDGSRDACDLLIDDTTRADVQVPDFRVAHQSFGKADRQAGRFERRGRVRREETIEVRGARRHDRIPAVGRPRAVPVEDRE